MRGLSLACLSLAVAACGTANTANNDFSSPVTACRSFATTVCTVESKCNPGTVDVSSCAQLLATRENCNQAGCAVGTNYSPTAAQQCNTDYSTQTCAESNSGVIPASCTQALICPAP